MHLVFLAFNTQQYIAKIELLEHFGCKTEFREAGLALVGLSAPESDLSDVGRLVGELFVETACVTFIFQLPHLIGGSDGALKKIMS